MTKDDLIIIRPWNFNDEPLIFSSWLKGFRYGNKYMELSDSAIYYSCYHKLIERILGDPRTIVLVACLKEDEDVVVGFSVICQNRLDWVFVKKQWRGNGIAKDLVPDNIASVSHLTDTGISIMKKYPGVIFNPFI